MVQQLKDFMEIMCWTPAMCIAQFHYAMCIETTAIVSSIEAEYDTWLDEYYSDFDVEIMRDAMWINHNC